MERRFGGSGKASKKAGEIGAEKKGKMAGKIPTKGMAKLQSDNPGIPDGGGWDQGKKGNAMGRGNDRERKTQKKEFGNAIHRRFMGESQKKTKRKRW